MAANSEQPRLVILDSHGILFRAFFALGSAPNPMMNSKGELTFATYGYAESLLRVLDQLKPTHICAAWDAKGKTFRHEAREDYKATRRKTPEDLLPQMERVREMLNAFAIPVYEAPGFEADDVAGTIATRTAAEGIDTWIVTLDTDLVQLIRPNLNVFMFRPYQRDTVVYDTKAASERWGFSPDFMTDFKALRGDSSDNIPGIKGVGDKTAANLIRQFGPVEEIFARLDEITSKSVRGKLEGKEEEALESKYLVTIRTDVPCDFNFDACKASDYDREQVVAFFRELEFRSLIDRLPKAADTEEMSVRQPQLGAYTNVTEEKELHELAKQLQSSDEVAVGALSTTGDSKDALLLGLSFATEPGRAWYVPLRHTPRLDKPSEQLSLEAIRKVLGPILADPSQPKIAYGAKKLLHQLRREELALEGVTHEASLMAFVLGKASQTLENLVSEQLEIELRPLTALTGTGRKAVPLAQVDPETTGELACQQIDFLLQVIPKMESQLLERGQWELYAEMELPLFPVLADMEALGVGIDISVLSEISEGLSEEIEEVATTVYEYVGRQFNIGSPQQLSDILFRELGLPATRRTKQGFSTDQRALEGLRETHPIIEAILQYRQLTKLKSTYLDALPEAVSPEDGRIHTDFQQTVATTGRLSSTNPNLQNIPVRTEMGRDIRRAFVPAGYHNSVYVAADYSQIELRVLAHIAEDKGLIEAFLADADIHQATAASVYGVQPEDVTRQMRDTAKMVNFGIAYGMGSFGLSDRTGMTREEATAFIDRYYTNFPGIKAWQEHVLSTTKEKGYAETLFGRRRYLPAIHSRNFQVRSAAEREAINMPIQGTAADIIKVAMIRIADAARRKGLQSQMILQVHDELIFEGPSGEAEEVAGLLAEIMPTSTPTPLRVPLKIDLKRGRTWAEL
ncbi:MAG: DNA polymerase I [Dehalococcoidia bacterium]|nr:DNA polymerase I [Dehalococcoidia bacterium]HCV00013.1 DNA polymerase I [Dehalococcoidia bacterium]